jgi:hypothetical protein
MSFLELFLTGSCRHCRGSPSRSGCTSQPNGRGSLLVVPRKSKHGGRSGRYDRSDPAGKIFTTAIIGRSRLGQTVADVPCAAAFKKYLYGEAQIQSALSANFDRFKFRNEVQLPTK